nr:VOC family protein [uncultured Campylobacter sp.]
MIGDQKARAARSASATTACLSTGLTTAQETKIDTLKFMEAKMNKITCICLGVRSMQRALKFYRDGLGFQTDCKEDNPPVCFFNTPGTKFELYPLDALARDIDENNPPKGNGFFGITLAYNVEHKEDVDTVIELVRKAGGKIVKEPQEVFWGGYHAYFSDLDRYYREVSWGPNFQFDENGLLKF